MLDELTRFEMWSILLAIGTLVSIIIGFFLFNRNTRNLEEIQMYDELERFYLSLHIKENIIEFDRNYEKHFNEFEEAYKEYISIHELNYEEDTNKHKEVVNSIEFYIFLRDLQEILSLLKELYLFIEDFNLDSHKYVSIFNMDIFKLSTYVHPIKDHLRFAGGGEQHKGTIKFYRFEHLIHPYEEMYKYYSMYREAYSEVEDV